MEAKKLIVSVAKVINCVDNKCKKDIVAFEKEKKKKVDPLRARLLKLSTDLLENKIPKSKYKSEQTAILAQLNVATSKLQESKQSKKLNHCMATRCENENRENFKVLASYHKKDCEQTKNKKACKLAKVSESYAKKTKYTGADIIKYKKLEMA